MYACVCVWYAFVPLCVCVCVREYGCLVCTYICLSHRDWEHVCVPVMWRACQESCACVYLWRCVCVNGRSVLWTRNMMFDCRRCPRFQACDDAEEINTVYNPKSFCPHFLCMVCFNGERERLKERNVSFSLRNTAVIRYWSQPDGLVTCTWEWVSEKDESLWRGWRQFVWSTKTNHDLHGY